jgi:hypothetical protein
MDDLQTSIYVSLSDYQAGPPPTRPRQSRHRPAGTPVLPPLREAPLIETHSESRSPEGQGSMYLFPKADPGTRNRRARSVPSTLPGPLGRLLCRVSWRTRRQERWYTHNFTTLLLRRPFTAAPGTSAIAALHLVCYVLEVLVLRLQGTEHLQPTFCVPLGTSSRYFFVWIHNRQV